MRHKLFTVEDTFNIAGRGIVVTGELEADSPACRIGSIVVLVRPDGNELVTGISGIEHVRPFDYENVNWNRVGITLKDVTKKEDAPVGTEVFREA